MSANALLLYMTLPTVSGNILDEPKDPPNVPSCMNGVVDMNNISPKLYVVDDVLRIKIFLVVVLNEISNVYVVS